MTFIQINNLTKNYEGEVLVEVLKSLNLSITEGEFVTIMGPSGSGKTTLLNLIATLDKPTAGSIFIDGQALQTLTKNDLALFRRRTLGFVFQNYNLLSPLNVEENIMLPLTLDHLDIPEIKQRANQLLVDLELTEKRTKRIHQLSGGEQQRVAIARALIHEPKLLLAEEPTGNLDSETARNVMEILREVNQLRKVITLMVTHDAYSASFSDRVIFIKDGTLFNEIYRGETQQQFYQKILDVLGHLGGRRHEF